jgi:hypothetical protein
MALQALGASLVGGSENNQTLTNEGMRLYGKVLGMLHQFLKDFGTAACDDRILGATRALMSVEVRSLSLELVAS